MKKIIYILLFILSYTAYSQSISIVYVDTSKFPTIKANFYAFDAEGKQIININASDFEVKENGVPRPVTYLSCPEKKPPYVLSLTMSIDNSGSMSAQDAGISRLELGKKTARLLCNIIPIPPSEFAIQVCDGRAYIIQDFTTDKSILLQQIDGIPQGGGNDFVEQLLNPTVGLLNIAKKGQNKKVAVLYTDAFWFALSKDDLQLCIDSCMKYQIQFFALIYSKENSEPDGIKNTLQSLANATGGFLYDGIVNSSALEDIALRLKTQSQNDKACVIEWQSITSCKTSLQNVELMLKTYNIKGIANYQSPNQSVTNLEFSPSSIKFINAIKDTCITVTAKANNADFDISNINISNPAYRINSSTNFTIKSGESKKFDVCYTPADSGYTYCKFIVENNLCPAKFYASGGFPGMKAKVQTLKLIQPNGGEVFVVGMDTNITWEGILEDEKVKIEYTTTKGAKWIPITDSAIGFSYSWVVPKTPSDQCLARVIANSGYECTSPEINICNQIWTGYNLDVDRYRNGDTIPEITDPSEWANAKTGAWCYYNNDPLNGLKYGKLYNWYAVNDPRGLAPKGWHIPSDEEWNELENCLGDSTIAGGSLKSKGTIEEGKGLWYSPNTGATNETCFTALPGGWRHPNEEPCRDLGYNGYFWSSTEYNGNNAWGRVLYYNFTLVFRNYPFKNCGFSVRCVKD